MSRARMEELLTAAAYEGWGAQPLPTMDKYEAIDILFGLGGELTELATEDYGTTRWHQLDRVVVKDEEGSLWSFTWQSGLTENQEDDWSDALHSLRQVEAREKTVVVTEYVEIEAPKV